MESLNSEQVDFNQLVCSSHDEQDSGYDLGYNNAHSIENDGSEDETGSSNNEVRSDGDDKVEGDGDEESGSNNEIDNEAYDHIISCEGSSSAESSENDETAKENGPFCSDGLIHIASFVKEYQPELRRIFRKRRRTPKHRTKRWGKRLKPSYNLSETLKKEAKQFFKSPMLTPDIDDDPENLDMEIEEEDDFTTKYNNMWVPPKAIGNVEDSGSADEGDVDPIMNRIAPFSDVVVAIQILEPFEFSTDREKRYLPLQPQQDVLVLGSQTLDKLQNIITCPNDFVKLLNPDDKCTNPANALNAKDHFKSSFFFFGHTFYIKTSQHGCKDGSKKILQWAVERSLFNHNLLTTESMESTYFKDLKVKFGHPYVYHHLGNCEHVIIFSNAKVISADDELCSNMYPMVKQHAHPTVSICNFCNNDLAIWITTGNHRVPYDPAFFCEKCYFSFNFVNGEKLCDFSSYTFVTDKFHDEFRQLMADPSSSETSDGNVVIKNKIN